MQLMLYLSARILIVLSTVLSAVTAAPLSTPTTGPAYHQLDPARLDIYNYTKESDTYSIALSDSNTGQHGKIQRLLDIANDTATVVQFDLSKVPLEGSITCKFDLKAKLTHANDISTTESSPGLRLSSTMPLNLALEQPPPPKPIYDPEGFVGFKAPKPREKSDPEVDKDGKEFVHYQWTDIHLQSGGSAGFEIYMQRVGFSVEFYHDFVRGKEGVFLVCKESGT